MSHRKSRRASSRDVAAAAGVSQTTVSFVLNERPGVSISAETRRRVLRAAEELGYQPSPEARALRAGTRDIVLCLLPDAPIAGPLAVVLQLVSAELSANGLTMLSHQRRAGELLSRALAALTPRAILALCDLTRAEVDFAERRGVPIRSFLSSVPGCPDEARRGQLDLGRLQVQGLASRGHRALAYVLPDDRRFDWFSEPRLHGAAEEAERLGIVLRAHRMADGHDAGAWARSLVDDGVTGVCAYNDELALTVQTSALDAGLRVPADVSILGVDDSPFSRLARPRMSTVGFDLAHEARRITSLITDDGSLTEAARIALVWRDSVRDCG